MAKHIETGKTGESISVEYLVGMHYQMLHTNWRYKHWEIDIIATKNGILHFIEVKTKSTNTFGFPEEEVTPKKFRFLTQAAEEYLYLNPQWKRIQFDILAITLYPQMEIKLIEDVYL